ILATCDTLHSLRMPAPPLVNGSRRAWPNSVTAISTIASIPGPASESCAGSVNGYRSTDNLRRRVHRSSALPQDSGAPSYAVAVLTLPRRTHQTLLVPAGP